MTIAERFKAAIEAYTPPEGFEIGEPTVATSEFFFGGFHIRAIVPASKCGRTSRLVMVVGPDQLAAWDLAGLDVVVRNTIDDALTRFDEFPTKSIKAALA
jgi:hypothetical protein